MSRHVVTGGLGTGKTSVISVLEGTLMTLPEPARALIAEHRALTGEGTLDNRPQLFVDRLIARSIRDYQSVPDAATAIFDRGIPDCVAYAAVFGIDPRPALDAAGAHRYENPVFVAPPWKDIYTTDDMRRATFAQAKAFHAAVISAYQRLGYELIELPRASVHQRAEVIVAHLRWWRPPDCTRGA